jgi:glycosyltransferase involved in cell wall biosynthesis
MQADITVCIPVRNGANFIECAIQSVREQTFSRWNLLIVDNRSDDATSSVVGRYLNDARIRLVVNADNLGMAGNFNRCLDLVTTPYYTILCHDDALASPEALARAFDILECHPNIAAVYSDLVYIDGRGLPTLHRSFKRSGYMDVQRLAKRSIIEARNLFGIPVLVRSSAARELRYDNSLPYVIDLDISISSGRNGSLFHISEYLIANRFHGGNGTGRLLAGVDHQMFSLAAKHQIPLTSLERTLIKLNALRVGFAKKCFLAWVKYARN